MSRFPTATGMAGLLLAALLAGCNPAPGEQVGDARLVADEQAYPGEVGPIVGEVARSDEDAGRLWDAVGLSGEPPPLEGEALVVVSGGQPDDCPWRLDEVTVDDEVARFALAPVSSLARAFGLGHCSGDWQPRTYAVVVPDDDLLSVREVELVVPWEYPAERVVTARPIAELSDPELWASRTLSADHLGAPFGCYDSFVAATTADGALLVEVAWWGEDDVARDVGDVHTVEGELPLEHVTVLIRTGTYVASDLCTDIDVEDRPLVADRWVGISGRLELSRWLREGAQFNHPVATVVLRDVVLRSSDPDAGQWHIEELKLRDVDVGGEPG